jgi:uncharacterized hydrophobic protein (TIGR00271 family)
LTVAQDAAEPLGAGRRLRVAPSDIDRMTARLYLTSGADSGAKTSAFWALLVLAAIIASAGVVSDSTATVIGAMIVAPLMTPILGCALAVALSERRMIATNAAYVVCGGIVVIAVGYLVGLTHQLPVDSATSSQVASRVSPTLIDLLAALATGVVGAFALVRADISDVLPGVAIAISLVPPLAVVGLTLESGYPRPAAVAVPLGYGTWQIEQQERLVSEVQPVATAWAPAQGWTVTDVTYQQNAVQITAVGQPPEASPASLRAALDAAGLADGDVHVTLSLGGSLDLPATGKR